MSARPVSKGRSKEDYRSPRLSKRPSYWPGCRTNNPVKTKVRCPSWVNRYRVQRAEIRPCPRCPKSGRKPATCDMPLRVDGDAPDVISSQQLVERWQGAASGNLGRGIVSSLGAVERLHRGTRRGRQDQVAQSLTNETVSPSHGSIATNPSVVRGERFTFAPC